MIQAKLIAVHSVALAAVVTLGLAGCASTPGAHPVAAAASTIEALFTVQAEGARSVVRAITRSAGCPDITWSNGRNERMRVRAEAALVPLRGDSAQSDSKPAQFDVLTCEIDWPSKAVSATVENQAVPAPRQDIRRIVLIADTGCRMKASENAFQECNDSVRWPFAQVAMSAAALKPDLVIHIGDIHYRESPCPAGNSGCTGSPWGYGYDTWKADLFGPAAPLLAAAPWLFVRGNHESCFRAGQGWFRFVDAGAWTNARSCDSRELDADADFSAPYAVPISAESQFIVFDSSKSSGQPYAATDPALVRYAAQMRQVSTLAAQSKHSVFLSHHPLLAFAPVDANAPAKPGGSRGLQSAFASVHPARLFPDDVSVVMHGHIHLFEAMSFSSDHPASMIFGNAGSAIEARAATTVTIGTEAYPGAHVDDYASRSGFGFAVMERISDAEVAYWRLTEYDTLGHAQIVCSIRGSKSRCKAAL